MVGFENFGQILLHHLMILIWIEIWRYGWIEI